MRLRGSSGNVFATGLIPGRRVEFRWELRQADGQQDCGPPQEQPEICRIAANRKCGRLVASNPLGQMGRYCRYYILMTRWPRRSF